MFPIHKSLIQYYARTVGLPEEDAEKELRNVCQFFFKELLHQKQVTIPGIGTLWLNKLHKDFPDKVKLTFTYTKSTLSGFIRDKSIPKADLYLSEEDKRAFEERLKEAYVTFNSDSD